MVGLNPRSKAWTSTTPPAGVSGCDEAHGPGVGMGEGEACGDRSCAPVPLAGPALSRHAMAVRTAAGDSVRPFPSRRCWTWLLILLVLLWPVYLPRIAARPRGRASSHRDGPEAHGRYWQHIIDARKHPRIDIFALRLRATGALVPVTGKLEPVYLPSELVRSAL